MSDIPSDTSVGDDGVWKHTPGGSGELSLRKAANSLTDAQNKRAASEREPTKPEPVSQPERAPQAPAADESADVETGSPDGATTDEGQEQAPDPDSPAIDPPSSWTKDAHERWSKLDRETQEYLVTRDREDNTAIKRKFQEAEESLKGLTAREQAMEQARLQFEALNQTMLQEYLTTLQGDYPDIKDMNDVQRLAEEDWARYNKWQVHQQRIALKRAEVEQATQRQAQEAQSKFAKFADEQDKGFVELVPEFADKEKAARLQGNAIETLKRAGFADDELTKLWNGSQNYSFRDKRQQLLIHKASLWDAAQAAKKIVSAKTLPPVQRPGVAQQSNSADQQIKAFNKNISNTKGNDQLRLLADRQTLIQKAASRSQ